MSNLQKFSVLDPRLDVSETFKKWYVMLGSPNVTQQTFPTTAYSSSSLSFNIPLPNSDRCIIDRSSVVVAIPIRITMHGPGTGGSDLIYQPLREGLRANPFDKIVQTSTYNMNGQQISYNNSEIIYAMEKYNSDSNNLQINPTMIDMSQSYTDTYMTNMSPFATRFSNPYETTRRAYPITVVSNTTTDAVLETVLLYNPFDYAPFTSKSDVVGINLTPFTISYTFVSQLSRLWSRDPAHSQPTSSFNVQMGFNSTNAQPKITMFVLSLPDGYQIPEGITYPYNRTTTFIQTTSAALAQGHSEPGYATQLIQLDTLPSLIYIFVKLSTSNLQSNYLNAMSYPDCEASISRISISLANKNNLLASCTPQDLYNMSKKNGLLPKISYPDFTGIQGTGDPYLGGSVICIDPSRDLSLESGFVCGASNKINFQAFIDFTCLNSATLQYDVNVIMCYDGMQIMNGTQCVLDHLPIRDISDIQESPISYAEMKATYGGFIGGDFKSFMKNAWGKLKEYAGPVNDFLKSTHAISKIAPMIPYIGPAVGTVARSLGYGDGSGMMAGDAGMMAGDAGMMAGEGDDFAGYDGGEDGGVLAGGRVLRRSQLRRNARR